MSVRSTAGPGCHAGGSAGFAPSPAHALQWIGNDVAARIRYAATVLFEKIIEIRDEIPRAAPLNMALDEVLLGDAREPIVRIYR